MKKIISNWLQRLTLEYATSLKNALDNPFWKDAAYSECCIDISPKTSQEINKINILYNNNIRIGGYSLRIKLFTKHAL